MIALLPVTAVGHATSLYLAISFVLCVVFESKGRNNRLRCPRCQAEFETAPGKVTYR